MRFDWAGFRDGDSGAKKPLRMRDDVVKLLESELHMRLFEFYMQFVQDPTPWEHLDLMLRKHMKRKQSHLVFHVDHSPDWQSHSIIGLSSTRHTLPLDSLEGLKLGGLGVPSATDSLVQALANQTVEHSANAFRSKALEAFTLLSIADRVAGMIGSTRYLRHDFSVWITTPSTTELLGIAVGGAWTSHSDAMGNFQFLPW